MKIRLNAAAMIIAGIFIVSAGASYAIGTKDADDFVQKASAANMFEIESSQLALQKTEDTDVHNFALQMIEDHNQAAKDLGRALPNSSADPSMVAKTLDPKHAKIMAKLKDASGADFDKKYIKAQYDAHKEAVDLFSKYSRKGKDSALKTFAANTLPTLQMHLDHVKQLKSEQ